MVNKELTQEQTIKSLRYSILDGIFYALMIGMGDSFLSPFAIFLNASNLEVALLASLPMFLGSIFQLFSNDFLTLCGSRQKTVCMGVFLQGWIFLPISLVFFLESHKVAWFIFCVALYRISGMIIGPVWNSWIGDIVPSNTRGKYFASRSRIMEFSTFLSLLMAGYILKLFGNEQGSIYKGFLTLFLIAFFCRMMSCLFLAKKYEPEYQTKEHHRLRFSEFLKREEYKECRSFVFYLAFMNMAVYLGSPFFTPYMLNEIKLDYFSFTIINATAVVAKIFSMPAWGMASDQFGSRRLLTLAGLLMPMSPILWFFSQQFWYLIFVQIYSGFVWAGFELCSFNVMFEITKSDKRVECISYYNVINGLALFLGSVFGAFFINTSETSLMYLYIFLISGSVRYMISFLYIPKLNSLKTQTNQVPYSKILLRVVTNMPTMGLIHHLITFKKKHTPSLLEEKRAS